MYDSISQNSTAIGTATGTVLTVAGNLVDTAHKSGGVITEEDLLKTVLLAAIGAVVSFCVSYGLKYLIKAFKKA